MRSAFTGFIDEHLESCSKHLRKENDECRSWFKRHIELREKLDDIEISEEDMALLQEYFQVEFDIAAANLFAVYRMDMAHVIRPLRILDVL